MAFFLLQKLFGLIFFKRIRHTIRLHSFLTIGSMNLDARLLWCSWARCFLDYRISVISIVTLVDVWWLFCLQHSSRRFMETGRLWSHSSLDISWGLKLRIHDSIIVYFSAHRSELFSSLILLIRTYSFHGLVFSQLSLHVLLLSCNNCLRLLCW